MTAIAAMAPGRVIGRAGALPWHYPEDLRFFRRTTMGHVVVMGRTTFESLGRRPLPGRENWVLSRALSDVPGVRIFRDAGELPPPPAGRGIFVIGGAAVYAALLPRCAELLLSLIAHPHPGDTFFPEFEADFVEAGEVARYEDFRVVRFVRRETP